MKKVRDVLNPDPAVAENQGASTILKKPRKVFVPKVRLKRTKPKDN